MTFGDATSNMWLKYSVNAVLIIIFEFEMRETDNKSFHQNSSVSKVGTSFMGYKV